MNLNPIIYIIFIFPETKIEQELQVTCKYKEGPFQSQLRSESPRLDTASFQIFTWYIRCVMLLGHLPKVAETDFPAPLLPQEILRQKLYLELP